MISFYEVEARGEEKFSGLQFLLLREKGKIIITAGLLKKGKGDLVLHERRVVWGGVNLPPISTKGDKTSPFSSFSPSVKEVACRRNRKRRGTFSNRSTIITRGKGERPRCIRLF